MSGRDGKNDSTEAIESDRGWAHNMATVLVMVTGTDIWKRLVKRLLLGKGPR
jgi:hypothetical protein